MPHLADIQGHCLRFVDGGRWCCPQYKWFPAKLQCRLDSYWGRDFLYQWFGQYLFLCIRNVDLQTSCCWTPWSPRKMLQDCPPEAHCFRRYPCVRQVWERLQEGRCICRLLGGFQTEQADCCHSCLRWQ